MNQIQKELINELKEAENKLGHSPKRRDNPWLARRCYRHFSSFNEAKKKAGLKIVNVRITTFPEKAFEKDKDLATIIAFLKADGHVYKDLKGFQFYSNNKKILKQLEEIVFRKFGLTGIYGEGNGYGPCFRYKVFNKIVTLFLRDNGAPAGDKMLVPFDVPEWIKENKEFSREYLKILFYCEGSKFKHTKNTEIIRINFNKSEKLLNDGLNFMNSLKEILKKFGIETTKIWISKGNIRKKDNEITKVMLFQIKSAHVNKFIKEIGWLK